MDVKRKEILIENWLEYLSYGLEDIDYSEVDVFLEKNEVTDEEETMLFALPLKVVLDE